MKRFLRAARLGILSAAVVLPSCGGSSPNNPSPTPSPAPSPTPNPPPSPPASNEVRTTTITITAAGVDPKAIVVSRGATVTFVNNDAPHDIDSDPHPIHTDCPELNVGFFGNGQARVSAPLNTVRTCGYHDHNQPTNTLFQGTIRIE